ncbi:hypothetical protein OC842_006281, partial [Tilletia horrida]
SFRRVYEAIPIVGIWDDHEVVNNWGGQEQAVRNKEGLDASTTAWDEYVGSANPDPLDPGEKYYTFRYGDSAFFVLDTRKLRSPASDADSESKTMIGEYQKDALMRWLGAVNTTATFKFVVSSVPFNTLWGGPLDWDGQYDTWSAYFTERQQILDVLQYVPNVVVLSGDRHEFASVGLRQTVTEFSTSPLSMFYLPVRTLSEEEHQSGRRSSIGDQLHASSASHQALHFLNAGFAARASARSCRTYPSAGPARLRGRFSRAAGPAHRPDLRQKDMCRPHLHQPHLRQLDLRQPDSCSVCSRASTAAAPAPAGPTPLPNPTSLGTRACECIK